MLIKESSLGVEQMRLEFGRKDPCKAGHCHGIPPVAARGEDRPPHRRQDRPLVGGIRLHRKARQPGDEDVDQICDRVSRSDGEVDIFRRQVSQRVLEGDDLVFDGGF